MRIKNILMLQVCMLSCLGLWGQKITVTGTITDAADGRPVPFATVIAKGAKSGVAVNYDGKYSIDAAIGDTLIFSELEYRYKAQEVRVEQSIIDVKMEEEIAELDTVVAIEWPRSHPTILVPLVGVITVSGTVTDSYTNRPIANVIISVKEIASAVASDIDGKYAISTFEGKTLVFSSAGYNTKEIQAKEAKLDVLLDSAASK